MSAELRIGLVVAIAVLAVLGWLSGKLKPVLSENLFPYLRKQQFLSAAERSFYGVLCQVVGPDQIVIAKVRLADLVRVEPGIRGKGFFRHFNRISGKHVDFVVCDRATMEPVYCVELDDRSHKARARADRDDFVDAVMEAAGVRLVHVPCQAAYGIEEVRGKVEG